MTPVRFTINGREVSDSIEPRMHLADFLRERLNLTATHLRCEQGVCGACTLLIDGQPARSCITYAVQCDGATITTLEGLADDPVIAALRRAFALDHALQCGYCTPGMLMSARDIVMRLPDADAPRIRTELSGNLCRCTGYAGIVRAVSRVLAEQRNGAFAAVALQQTTLGPVGARRAAPTTGRPALQSSAAEIVEDDRSAVDGTTLGLVGRPPTIEIRQSFTVSRPPAEVWAFFGDIAQVVPCLPGASLTRPPQGDQVEGRMSVKLGPMTANFTGRARIVRDDAWRRGQIIGSGRDPSGGSRAAGEVDYAVASTEGGGTEVMLTIRALLSGPLAQFGRSRIVADLVGRITDTFARNLEARLTGAPDGPQTAPQPLGAGTLLWQVVVTRLKSLFGRRTP
jgi:carbon-monoxide dehydrogenase small subunit